MAADKPLPPMTDSDLIYTHNVVEDGPFVADQLFALMELGVAVINHPTLGLYIRIFEDYAYIIKRVHNEEWWFAKTRVEDLRLIFTEKAEKYVASTLQIVLLEGFKGSKYLTGPTRSANLKEARSLINWDFQIGEDLR